MSWKDESLGMNSCCHCWLLGCTHLVTISSVDDALYRRWLLQGSLVPLQFHYLLTTYWARQCARVWKCKDKKIWFLPSFRSWHSRGDWDAAKSCKAIFLKHISVCAIMHIFMCLPVHSLSSIIAMRWKLSHSLLCVQHPSTWSLEDVKDSKIFMNKFYARSISEGLFQSAEGNQERLLRGGGSMSSWFNIIMVGWLHY